MVGAIGLLFTQLSREAASQIHWQGGNAVISLPCIGGCAMLGTQETLIQRLQTGCHKRSPSTTGHPSSPRLRHLHCCKFGILRLAASSALPAPDFSPSFGGPVTRYGSVAATFREQSKRACLGASSSEPPGKNISSPSRRRCMNSATGEDSLSLELGPVRAPVSAAHSS